MTKRILKYVAILLATFFVTYFSHYYIVENSQILHTYSVLNVYLFHVVSSLIIYLMLEMAAEYIPANAGYIYLSGVFIKMGFFLLVFQDVVFGKVPLTQPERVSLVVPLFIFLILEVFFIGKLLNSK